MGIFDCSKVRVAEHWWFKFHDFRRIKRSRSYRGMVDTHQLLRQASLGLMRSIYPPGRGIRLVGVIVSNFGGDRAAPAELPLAAVGVAA